MIELKNKLNELADEKYKKFQRGLCPGTNDIMGVRLPLLKKLAKELVKENPIEFLNEYNCKVYEEKMIYGLVIGYMNETIDIRLKYLKRFVSMIDNWAVCDSCSSTYKFTNKNLEKVFEFLQQYIRSKNEFEVRFVVIMLMDYYLTDKYIDKVFKIYNEISLDKYYVKMAIAWGISEAFVKNENKTREFLETNSLDKFTFNKALQKIIESNRTNKEIKEEMKRLKIK